jgi:hypothetical protein
MRAVSGCLGSARGSRADFVVAPKHSFITCNPGAVRCTRQKFAIARARSPGRRDDRSPEIREPTPGV